MVGGMSRCRSGAGSSDGAGVAGNTTRALSVEGERGIERARASPSAAGT